MEKCISDKIAILMATYNSSQFIREQLDSLYSQSYMDWELYIHDDGSNDNTLDIIEQYSQRYENIRVIGKEVKALGPKNNFMFLLNNADADYYLFCDHDDVWFPNKIELTIQQIKKNEIADRSNPVLFHSDLHIVDTELKTISNSMWHYAKIRPDLLKKKNYVMVSCFITGCTLGINKATKELVKDMPDKAIMHDWWIGVKAVMSGAKVISWPEATVYYRLHGNNDSGIPQVKLMPYLKHVFTSFFVSEYDRNIAVIADSLGFKYYKLRKSIYLTRRFLNV